MPTKNGRLTCCSCGADLGDANDPYRDPDCLDCLHREIEQEMEMDEEWERQKEAEVALGVPALAVDGAWILQRFLARS